MKKTMCSVGLPRQQWRLDAEQVFITDLEAEEADTK